MLLKEGNSTIGLSVNSNLDNLFYFINNHFRGD